MGIDPKLDSALSCEYVVHAVVVICGTIQIQTGSPVWEACGKPVAGYSALLITLTQMGLDANALNEVQYKQDYFGIPHPWP